jgi:hypothetical protein
MTNLIGFADLHTHTTASDGTFAPEHNVRLASEAGLAAIAITDHDTVAGIDEAITAGERFGVEVVPGVEISTVAEGQDIHVLGYYMDYRDKEFLNRLEQLRETRNKRNDMILERLEELGIHISMSDVMESANKSDIDETIGRPHIADALVRKGYVSNMEEAFDLYLGKTGQAYVNPPRIRPMDAIDWIRAAGGVAVLAHPGLYDNDTLVQDIVDYGVDGIEAFHSDHTPEQEKRYETLALSSNLIITGGSDFHGERQGIVFHAPLGARKVPIATVRQLHRKKL